MATLLFSSAEIHADACDRRLSGDLDHPSRLGAPVGGSAEREPLWVAEFLTSLTLMVFWRAPAAIGVPITVMLANQATSSGRATLAWWAKRPVEVVREVGVQAWSAGSLGLSDADPIERTVRRTVLRSGHPAVKAVARANPGTPKADRHAVVEQFVARGQLAVDDGGRLSIVARRRGRSGASDLLDRICVGDDESAKVP